MSDWGTLMTDAGGSVISMNSPKKVQQPPCNNGRQWTSKEDRHLRTLAASGIGLRAIAADLGRSESSVKSFAARMLIPLRAHDSRAGLVLGQPRGVSLLADQSTAGYRDLMLSGKVRPHVLAIRVALSIGTQTDVCPLCGKHYVATAERSKPANIQGVCITCHLQGLVEVQKEELAAIAGHQDLDTAYQHKRRSRKSTLQAILRLIQVDPWFEDALREALT